MGIKMGIKYEVIISDKSSLGYAWNKSYFSNIDVWAKQNCPSYIGYSVDDVSDVSLLYDELGSYRFKDKKDVMWFTLKWK